MTDREIRAIRDRYPGHLILVKAGDLWLAFGGDAGRVWEAAKAVPTATRAGGVVPPVTLERGPGQTFRHADVPACWLEPVLRQLMAAGHKVALAEATA